MATKNVREGLTMLGLDQLGVGPLNLGNVLGSVELMRKVWSTVTMPGSLAPTLDVEELDKRIGDLRAVEQWLAMNLNMLRGTIQALEVQRGTVATLRAFGSAVAPPGREPTAQAITIDPARLMAAIAQMQAAATATPGDAEPAAGEPTAAAEPGLARAGAARRRKQEAGSSPSPLEPGALANAWWSLLQSQFNQVANAAISGVGLGAAAVRDGARQMASRTMAGVTKPAQGERPRRDPDVAAPDTKGPRAKATRAKATRAKVAKPARTPPAGG